MRPSGVYLSTASGKVLESLARISSRDIPVCWDRICSTSAPIVCSNCAGAVNAFLRAGSLRPHAPQASGSLTRDAQGHVNAGEGPGRHPLLRGHRDPLETLATFGVAAIAASDRPAELAPATAIASMLIVKIEPRIAFAFKPAIEFVLSFGRYALIRDLICHDSFSLQPRRIYKRPDIRRASSFDHQRESAGQIVVPSYLPEAHLLCDR